MCDWVRFSVGGVWGGRSCMPCCAWRARSGVMLAQCAVREWLVLCGTSCWRAGLVCLYSACECAMCVAWVVGLRATYDALIVGAVSSAVSMVLCRSIAIAALCCRVCVAALCFAVAAV